MQGITLTQSALNQLREIKKRVLSEGDEPVGDDRILHNYDMVIFKPTTDTLNADGTVDSDLKYVNADNDDLELITDGTCVAIEVNSIPDA